MVEIWLFFLSNLCHLLKVNALLDVLPQLLHHSDVDVCLQKSGAHFLQWVQVDIPILRCRSRFRQNAFVFLCVVEIKMVMLP